MSFTIEGPNSLGWTPAGIATITYYERYSNQVVVKGFPIGSDFGSVNVSVVTGSLAQPAAGAVSITINNSGVSVPIPYKSIGAAISGIFSTSGYNVVAAGVDTDGLFKPNLKADYPPGFLEQKKASIQTTYLEICCLYTTLWGSSLD
jgi:hypothetical protein